VIEEIKEMKTETGDQYEMRILRVDLSSERIDAVPINHEVARKYVGGTGLGQISL
jgi:aldehyde:ferredoxin oxidoreductase